MSRLSWLSLRPSRLRGTGILPTLAALVAGVATAASIALGASVALDPAGAQGRTVHEYRPSPVVQRVAPHAVTAGDLAAAGPGTPGAALLRWWQTMQLTGSPERAVADLMPARDAAERRRFVRELAAIRYVFTASRPRLVDHERVGDRAVVLVVLARTDRAVPEHETHQLERFDLVRVGGRWRIGTAFVHDRYAAELAFARTLGQPR